MQWIAHLVDFVFPSTLHMGRSYGGHKKWGHFLLNQVQKK